MPWAIGSYLDSTAPMEDSIQVGEGTGGLNFPWCPLGDLCCLVPPPPVECTVACVCYPISHESVWSQLQAMFVSHTEPNAINVSAHGAIPRPGRGTGSERSPRVAAGAYQQPVSSILNSLSKPVMWMKNTCKAFINLSSYSLWCLLIHYSNPIF